MQILGHKNVRKMEKNAKIVLSAPSRHNGRKIPAYNAGEIDGDKRDPGIARHRYPERELCRYGGLALGKSEHRTKKCPNTIWTK